MLEHNEILEIKERLVKIEMLLENVVTTNDLKLVALDEKIKVANNRISDLEDTNKWLWRTVCGSLITGGISILIAFVKLGVI